jgi:radical SAM protein with 4Fe4S-binding SPASM domain
MEEDIFKRIAGEAASLPQLSRVIFELHNEPLLDDRIFTFIKYFKSLNPDKSCAIVTNGELLNRFSSTDIIQSNLDSLIVSLNAYSRKIYEAINRGLSYTKVMRNISSLLSDQNLKQKLMLSYVTAEQNVQEIQEATQHWKKQGVKTRVMTITNRAGSLEDYGRLRLKNAEGLGSLLSRIGKRLTSHARGFIGCELPFYQMNILFNGDVIICCHDWERTTLVGNIRDNSLRQIWNSERMNEIRRLVIAKRYEQIGSCRECSIIR